MPVRDPIDTLAFTAGQDAGEQRPGLVNSFNSIISTANQDGRQVAIADARRQSRAETDVDIGTFERKTRGLDLSDRQKSAARKRGGLARVIAAADRVGSVGRGFTDRAKAARQAGSGLSDQLFGQRVQQEASDANIFGSKTAAAANRKANKKTAVIGTIGKVLGIAAMFAFSSEDYKDDRGKATNILDKLKKIRINEWNYKGDQHNTYIGPFAEEFNAEMGIQTDRPDMISMIDALGVTLGAVKELNAKVEARG